MWILTAIISYLLTRNCLGIYLVDVPMEQFDGQAYENPETRESNESNEAVIQRRLMNKRYPPVRNEQKRARQYLFRQSADQTPEEAKDLDIKNKISTFVQQTVHDTDNKMKSIQNLKNKHRDQAPYKIGFILSMIKKARDVLNELFNVAVKHRDEWKALEQLKIFELIVHTNVDTTNLVRQMVEIHIQHLNATGSNGTKKRVVLL